MVKNKYKIPAGEHTMLKIKYSNIAELFDVSVSTVKQWVRTKKLNPKSLKDIIDKYNHRYLLDKRTKEYREIRTTPQD